MATTTYTARTPNRATHSTVDLEDLRQWLLAQYDAVEPHSAEAWDAQGAVWGLIEGLYDFDDQAIDEWCSVLDLRLSF